MFWNKKSHLQTKNIDSEIPEEIKKEPVPIRIITGGVLYDTSKAQLIDSLRLPIDDIPDYDYLIYELGGIYVEIYKGNSKYFIKYYGNIYVVDEDYVKLILGKYKPDKYIELFGEPPLA